MGFASCDVSAQLDSFSAQLMAGRWSRSCALIKWSSWRSSFLAAAMLWMARVESTVRTKKSSTYIEGQTMCNQLLLLLLLLLMMMIYDVGSWNINEIRCLPLWHKLWHPFVSNIKHHKTSAEQLRFRHELVPPEDPDPVDPPALPAEESTSSKAVGEVDVFPTHGFFPENYNLEIASLRHTGWCRIMPDPQTNFEKKAKQIKQ